MTAFREIKRISRDEIIQALSNGLKNNKAVFALWLEGADSNNTVDAFSDLDFWLDVDDGKECRVLADIEKILRKLGSVACLGLLDNPDPQIMIRAYHLDNTPATLLIDICIQRHSRHFVFIREHIHEQPKILFDKCHVIKYKKLNMLKDRRARGKRVEFLKSVMSQRERIIAKIKRKDFLEALLYYHKWTLVPLVELLRIRYSPLKRDYHLKHVSRDLPPKIVSHLEDLYKVTSLKDIQSKLKKAEKIFSQVLKQL